MGRSVSVPHNAVYTAYESLQYDVDSEDPAFVWDEYLESLQDRLVRVFPSFHPCDTWLGNENHVIMENEFCRISVAYYCGLISISMLPVPDSNVEGLAENWFARIRDKFFDTVGTLSLCGTASNGEQFFKPIYGGAHEH